MTLYSIAVSNLIRRKGKTAFILIGLLVGITACVSLLTITQAMKRDFEAKIDKFGANILITPKKDELSLTYGSVTLPGLKLRDENFVDQIAVKNIRKIKDGKDIKLISPKIIGASLINGNNVITVGLDFNTEKRLKSWWSLKGKYPSKGNEVIVGSLLASKLKIKKGDVVNVGSNQLKIIGLLEESGTSDDYVLFGKLSSIQKLLGKQSKLSLIEASVSNTGASVEKIAKEINAKFGFLQAQAIREAMKSKQDNIKMFTLFSLITSAIILIIASLIVFITMVSSINERTREIGIFGAVGFREKHIISIILTEATITSFAGGLMGSILGYFVARLVMPKFSPGVAVYLDPVILLSAIVVAIMLGIFASFLPANKAARENVAQALRFI